ncbi:uncharacterized protein P174DRAFT_418936 [Aspergillus novofumigatus IBT 16806]|uniref:Uncharacterized protein n=1 Tax=Aspergillus novofumigatus (strain IBT 16806) TaxID=1392255 RepID=A0A2I1CBK0_ASPN1|nr:uncharacterized protein P174DRAFT_418936 [Aspergillus novofumigatus IBT 16806]PKX94966.1 hypothetical protein P174DRAFT_418936 [Aspergillus novofumigatus IBT 16806]
MSNPTPPGPQARRSTVTNQEPKSSRRPRNHIHEFLLKTMKQGHSWQGSAQGYDIRNLEAGTDERRLDYDNLRCDSPLVFDSSMLQPCSSCGRAPSSAFAGRKYAATQAVGYDIVIVLRVDQVVGAGGAREIDPIVKESYRSGRSGVPNIDAGNLATESMIGVEFRSIHHQQQHRDQFEGDLPSPTRGESQSCEPKIRTHHAPSPSAQTAGGRKKHPDL